MKGGKLEVLTANMVHKCVHQARVSADWVKEKILPMIRIQRDLKAKIVRNLIKVNHGIDISIDMARRALEQAIGEVEKNSFER